jgi:hypothetical protein
MRECSGAESTLVVSGSIETLRHALALADGSPARFFQTWGRSARRHSCSWCGVVWVTIALHELGARREVEDYGDPYETAWLDVTRYRQFYLRKRMPVAHNSLVSWGHVTHQMKRGACLTGANQLDG